MRQKYTKINITVRKSIFSTHIHHKTFSINCEANTLLIKGEREGTERETVEVGKTRHAD
jgi:hypothetical protein